MDEEEEICRVCRSEGSPEHPLFHPCKCTGSIRHVHQDCLIEWLSHSRQQHCELCKHPFTFTPVYRPDMPEVLPPTLIIQQFNKKIFSALLYVLRVLLVGFIWVVFLPYLTIWIWRLYFFLGDHISRRLYNLQQVKHQLDFNTTALNLTSVFFTAFSDNQTTTAAVNWLEEYKSRLTMHTFLSDCFEGQLITCIIFIFFISIFLLKEWIIQNIPMEEIIIIEDNDQDEFLQDIQPQPVIQQEQPNDARFDSLFDIRWDTGIEHIEDEIQPPSPIAVQDDIWFNESSVFDNYTVPSRAESMPPTVFRYEEEEEEERFRRASSMEPHMNETVDRNLDNSIRRTQPSAPLAPLMRHAIQPIIEEEEDDDDPVIAEPARPRFFIAAQNNENNNAAGDVQEIANQQAANEEEEEDEEENADGLLEAIGMEGNLLSLAQNTALMLLLIAVILGVTVWMPYLIGMLFIMTEVLDVVRIPLQCVRLLTDPFIDFLLDRMWPSFVDFYHLYFEPVLKSTLIFDKMLNLSISLIEYMYSFVFSPTPTTLSDTVHVVTNETNTATKGIVDHCIQYMTNIINGTEPFIEQALNRYQQLAIGKTVTDRSICIVVGYIILIAVSYWYLSNNTRDNIATAVFGLTAKEAFRHQCIILKVGFYLILELFVLPVLMGFAFDISTLPLFQGATMTTRFVFAKSHPASFLFLHWFLGTVFTFSLAWLIGFFRQLLRPGVMWFIRDPSDPDFHPIREIAERPLMSKLKKICVSALLCVIFVFTAVATVIYVIQTISPTIFPLRWSLSGFSGKRSPFSVVPIDIILLQVGLPLFIKYYKPSAVMFAVSVRLIKFVSRQLRLTSFLFGRRRTREEGNLIYHTWSAWIRGVEPELYPAIGSQQNVIGDEVTYITTGQLLRVPSHDNVPYDRLRRMLVPVDPIDLEPINAIERELGHPAAIGPGGMEHNTTVVYAPPNIRRRLILFAIIIWLCFTVIFCSVVLVPIAFGRYLFKDIFKVEEPIHDIYSFSSGIIILTTTASFIRYLYLLYLDIKYQPTWSERKIRLIRHLKKWKRRGIHWTWFITWFGVVIPLAFGTLFQLYVKLPLSPAGKDAAMIDIGAMWSTGFSCMLVGHWFIRAGPPGRAKDTIEAVFRRGIGKMDIRRSFKEIIAPLLVVSACGAGLPFLVAYFNMFIGNLKSPELRLQLIQAAYPVTFLGIATFYLGKIGYSFGRQVSDSIRQDTYLVGQTLHNHEH